MIGDTSHLDGGTTDEHNEDLTGNLYKRSLALKCFKT